MEDTRSVAGWLGSQELLLGRVYSVDEVVAQIDAVDYDQLMTVAKRILDPSLVNLVVVGPFEKREEFAAAIGV